MKTIKKLLFFILAILTLLLCCSCSCDSTGTYNDVESTTAQTVQDTSFENSTSNTASDISLSENSYTKSTIENTDPTSAQDVLGVFDSDQVEDE